MFSAGIVVISVAVIVGLYFNIEDLYKWGHEGVGMAFPTAVTFLLVSLCLFVVSALISRTAGLALETNKKSKERFLLLEERLDKIEGRIS